MAAVSRENWVERIRDPKIECMSRDEIEKKCRIWE